MSAPITPQLVEVIDVFSSRRRHPSGHVHELEICEIEPWGLAMLCPFPYAPEHDAEITFLLADLGLKLTRLRPRDPDRFGTSVLTSVSVQRDTRTWEITDLVLGLEIPEHGRPRVIRAAEFATAVARGGVRQSEADYAFSTVHRTLHELAQHRTISQWLAHRGIFEPWD